MSLIFLRLFLFLTSQSTYCYFNVALSAVVTLVGEYKVTNSSIILVLSNITLFKLKLKYELALSFHIKLYTQCPGVVHYTVYTVHYTGRSCF
jgi:hypothetical protein